VDPDVDRLIREERLLEAARLASERGDTRAASTIYERACEWRQAAVEAIRSQDAARAVRLAAQAGDEETAEQAMALLVRNPAAAKTAASDLAARRQYAWAARVLERCGEPLDGARAWERAGDALRAAALFERTGGATDAERVLRAALGRDPSASAVASALGALLTRFGDWEAAVRVLQRVPPRSRERRSALRFLRDALAGLGLGHAADLAASELGLLGQSTIGPECDPSAAPGANRASGRRALFLGRYDLVREVASSPHARVLECIDVVRGERVAVKMFVGGGASGEGRDAVARFGREARTMKALDHPNVVPVRDVIAEPPALVLTWMHGGTLEELLATAAPIAPARAFEIACAVLSALGAAHRLGILHRDVKPANVLFDEAGGARLGDFGVAHLGDLSTTATAGIFGTLAYMSPEQREGRPASLRSDVFAVGIMLREMLTREKPRPDGAAARPPSQAHRELDPRHDAAIDRMTARDERQRPVDTTEAREMLAALPWTSVSLPHVARPSWEGSSDGTERSGRIEPVSDGIVLDHWTGRKVEQLALTDRALAHARAFALADHEGLQTVLRVDAPGLAIWLEALEAPALHRPLTHPERARLRSALDALHEVGGVHGRVDAQHVLVSSRGVVLRVSTEANPTATPSLDRLALARL
jgi:tRNA A-37 threonylcarbamoyl transferase component Bud32